MATNNNNIARMKALVQSTPVVDLTPPSAENKKWNSKEDFGDPMRFEDQDIEEISADFLPSPYKEYAQAVTNYAQTPAGFSAVFLLAILATCLQKKYVVSPYGDKYIEPLSLWVLPVLAVGEKKTAVFQAVVSPLNEWTADKKLAMASELRKNRASREVAEAQIKHKKELAAKAKDDEQTEKLLFQIETIEKNMPEELRLPKLFTSDVTPASLEDELVENDERMAILSDEGDGIFETISGLFSDGKSNIDVLLKGHAGSPHNVRRQKRQADLKAPALSFGLTIQPYVLEKLGGGNQKKFRGIGMLARFLYYIPKPKVGTRNVRQRDRIEDAAQNAYTCAVRSLLDRPTPASPERLVLSVDALESWLQFLEWLEPQMAPMGEFGDVKDWASKAGGASIRIAGLLHAADPKTHVNVIENKTMLASIDLVKVLIKHAVKALDAVGNSSNADPKWALDWILHHKIKNSEGGYEFKENELHKASRFKNDTKERLAKSLSVLEQRNIISPLVRLNTKKPTLVRYLNPALIQSTGAA